MTTVFHPGELLIQTESGVDQRIHKVGNKLIRDHIIEQHKLFFENLSYVFIALHDNQGRPWISIIQNNQGFINTPDPKTLNLNGHVIAKDLLDLQIKQNNSVGVLGLDLSTRRRNRLNGYFNKHKRDDYLSIAVDQSFGNCPKYIQLRNLDIEENNKKTVNFTKNAYQEFTDFDINTVNLITKSDTLFIASATKQAGDLDASHRGGQPGFIKVKGTKQLYFNDYPGNNFFQTFGNIYNYPYIGLMFIDFNSGDVFLMSGKAHLAQTSYSLDFAKKNANFLPRRCYFTLEKGIKIKQAIKGQWSEVEMSPFLNTSTLKASNK